MTVKRFVPGMLGLLGLAVSVSAQSFTKADSGWVQIYNGKNLEGLYSRLYGMEVKRPADTSIFQVRNPGTPDAAIYVVSGRGREGHLGTEKKYSHYRARIMYKFDVTTSGVNAGFTYHTDEVPRRMNDNWPRSIECQMMQGNAGRAYSIAMATFKTRQTSGRYNPSGQEVEVCEKAPCNGRDYGASEINDKAGQWNTMEIVVRGSDSALHIVNGKTVMKIWNIRAPATGEDYATLVPYGSGSLAVQSEGANLTYKSWEIMELPKDGPNTLSRLFLTALDSGEKIAPGTAYALKWNTLGEIKKVSLQYTTTGTTWKTIADSIANTGTYTWTVPAEGTKTLRIRVGGPAWAVPDTSDGNNEITGASALAGSPSEKFFTISGARISLEHLGPGAVLQVIDIAGRLIGTIPVLGQETYWNGLDAKGETVPQGLYFVRIPGMSALRTWVF